MCVSADLDSECPMAPADPDVITFEWVEQIPVPFRGPRRFRLDEQGCMLDRWLSEFQDESTGCTSPPPMH